MCGSVIEPRPMVERTMTTAYYSTVLNHPLESVWTLIRDFNNYPAYIEGVSESVIEDDKGGDEVGAVRRFCYLGNWIRQRLAGHSDEAHTLTYAGARADALRGDDAPAAGRRGQQDIYRVESSTRHRAAGCRSLADAVPVLDSGLDSFARKGVRPPSRVRLWASPKIGDSSDLISEGIPH
jgi:hypothetical protein